MLLAMRTRVNSTIERSAKGDECEIKLLFHL